MPITKETAKALAKKGNEMKAKYKNDLWAYITSGGLRKSMVLLNEMLDGEEISKEQKEAIELLVKFMPYVKARKTDITTDGEKLPSPIINAISTDNSNDQDNRNEEKD